MLWQASKSNYAPEPNGESPKTKPASTFTMTSLEISEEQRTAQIGEDVHLLTLDQNMVFES